MRTYLRRTTEMWSGATPVERLEDTDDGKFYVRVLSGDPKHDNELKRERILEVTVADLVSRR